MIDGYISWELLGQIFVGAVILLLLAGFAIAAFVVANGERDRYQVTDRMEDEIEQRRVS